jgi:hypothetical protein
MGETRWKTLHGTVEAPVSGMGQQPWVLGQWEETQRPLVLCSTGFHASRRLIEAMAYVQPTVMARVEVDGACLKDTDKEVWARMRVMDVWPWTALDSVALAIFAAELVLERYEQVYPEDRRPREAIEAAKTYLHNPSGAAGEAAGAAGEAAAGAAARAAAGAAARAAAGAAAEDIRNQCEDFITQCLGIIR